MLSVFREHKGAVMSKTVVPHSCPWTYRSMKTGPLDNGPASPRPWVLWLLLLRHQYDQGGHPAFSL